MNVALGVAHEREWRVCVRALLSSQSSLCPGHAVDRVIRERMEDKFRDQLRAMQIEYVDADVFVCLCVSVCGAHHGGGRSRNPW